MMFKVPSHFKSLFVVLLSLTLLGSCKKTEDRVFPNNEAQSPHRIPTIKIESYVNRLFIDIIGRSALEIELANETDTLKEAKLSEEARRHLVTKLQLDTLPRIGDSSYRVAYHQRLYDIMKSRMCEGAPDNEFTRYVGTASFSLRIARLEGDSIRAMRALEIIERNKNVVDGKFEMREGEITVNQLFARMMNNNVYDNINMNTFNFVNASFDDLFFRFPSQTEFNAGFEIIERNITGSLLGGFASNKGEYCELLTESDEFYEGLIRWSFETMMGRDATTQEVVNHFEKLIEHKDIKKLQEDILITDEYANF
jgi:hypothetical protein